MYIGPSKAETSWIGFLRNILAHGGRAAVGDDENYVYAITGV